MDPKQTVQTLFDAVQAGDFDKAKSLLTSDFQFSGPVPEPLSGPQWLGMSANLKAAFPDLDYQFKVEGADGNTVNISAQLKGTHTGNLDLSAMGMGVIPPTDKSFAATRETGTATVEGDQVKSWAVNPSKTAGLMAILAQLGIQPPA